LALDLSQISRYPAPVRVVIFILALAAVWVPIAVPINFLVGLFTTSPEQHQNTATILTLLILYAEFILLVRLWGRWVYHQPRLLWRYGLDFSHQSGKELLLGLAIGVTSLFALFIAEGILGWLEWLPSPNLIRVALEGLLVALGIGFAEELLFRGWLLDELQRDHSPKIALWASAIVFASVHGFRAQFPALVLLGATLVWAKRSRSTPAREGNTSWDGDKWKSLQGKHSRERLALPMGLHAGLVWGYYIINVGQIVKYTDRAAGWVTGVDRNPLAGLVGLLFLSILTMGMWWSSRKRKP